MKRDGSFLLKSVIGATAVVVVVILLFFNLDNLATWMALNNPFQKQWGVVQLLDGEILYGHFAGVSGTTIGLTDVYLLDKVVPVPNASSSADGLSLEEASGSPAAQPALIPISDTPQLFVNRASVLYFKFVPPDDPALPYLH